MKALGFLTLAVLFLAGCSDTVAMRSVDGRQDVCNYSLMYRALHQCVATAKEDGMTMANGPDWWTFYR